MAITITPEAAAKFKERTAQEGIPDANFRLGVQGGGCSGLTYTMLFDNSKPAPTDKTSDSNGVTIVVDAKSYLYLNGSVIDYVQSPMQSGFTVQNPNAKQSCGCGTSFTT